ncbi:MAG TPA: WYL domain-containing protein [Burkholderiaceae bacterium]|jgi:predicted DNA-binding transcriptional regulator YafY|nr:WYL domain-containing protein [Burkholderiaceae bacterium]
MDRTERFYRIELAIRGRQGVSFGDLLKELEVSPATLKRDLQYLRDRMDAPIVYDRDANVYRFAEGVPGESGAPARAHQLPGVWFSEREIHALLTMHQLVAGLDDGGVLSRHLQPLLDKLHGMLDADADADAGTARSLMRRVRIVNPARRPVPSRYFEESVSAVLGRRRLAIAYWSRMRRTESERVVSPQRLLHYRNTWYLDAWCHVADELRRFALDAVRSARVLDEAASEVPLDEVEAALDQGYGVFGGAMAHWATLDFDAESAQWVAQEEWHPRQTMEARPDGGVRMRLPYTDWTELVMDVMRHGPHVRVVDPPELVAATRRRLESTLAGYGVDAD